MSKILSESEVNQLLAALEGDGATGRNSDDDDVLTQDDIGTLLDAIRNPKKKEDESIPDARRVSIYDFARPNRLHKSDIKELAILGHIIANQLSLGLTEKTLGTMDVNVHLSSVDQCAYKEAIRAICNPSMTSQLMVGGYDEVFFDVDCSLGYTLLGNIEVGQFDSKKHHKQPLPKEDFKIWNHRFLRQITSTLKTALGMRVEDRMFSTDSKNIKVIDDKEMGVMLTFDVALTLSKDDGTDAGLAKTEGLMALMLPWKLAKKIVEKRNGKKKEDDGMGLTDKIKNSNKGERTTIAQKLRGTKMKVEGVLGQTEMTLEEVTRFKNGTIIPLDNLAGSDVDVVVNGKVVAKAEVVVIDEKYALRIVEED